MNNRLLFFAFFFFAAFQHLHAQARFLEPVFDQVMMTPNVPYGMNATVLLYDQFGEAIPQALRLDFYEPAGDTVSTRPLVIVLPGGNYLPDNFNGNCDGSKSDSSVVEICTRLAKMGYTAASIEYRLGWNPLSPQADVRLWTFVHALYRGIQDARTAIRFFKKTATEDANPFRVDTSRIVLWGESAGGQIALGAAYANEYADWVDPSLMLNIPPIPMPIIIQQADGNIWGTDVGIVPPDFPPGFATPGDTMCYPNWPGYSSDFQLCVSMAGYTPDVPWLGPGEIPAVLFHAPGDEVQPCGDGILAIPPVLLTLISVSGSCSLAEQLDAFGNNQVFENADLNDCITANAGNLNGGVEGFYPFIGEFPPLWRPWHWGGSCPNNPNVPTDGTFARQYLDTVFAYFASRSCAALGHCLPQPDPTGLCGSEAKGKVYLDANQNGLPDPGESPFPGAVIELQPGNLHAVSGLNGNYSFSAPPGDYMLDVPNPPAYYTTVNLPLSVTVPASGDAVQSIGMEAAATADDIQVFLTPLGIPRPGFSNTFSITWKNVGTTTLSGAVTLTTDPNYLIVSGSQGVNITGNTATWTVDNLQPLGKASAWLETELPANVPIGVSLSSSVSAMLSGTDDENPLDNVAAAQEIVVGSYDPNDKRVLPEGDVTESVLADHKNLLDYTVRFQNTGTAPAIHVYIVDTLSELVNVNTLEIIGASHPMRWNISGERTVTWFFDNIQLPDSVSDEPASHGYVRYRIQPKLPFSGLLNKTVRNFADIYFDFNAPVRTNTAETKFVQAIGVKTLAGVGAVSISPNPAQGPVTVSCPLSASEASLGIFGISGKQIMNQKAPVHDGYLNVLIQTDDLPKGCYFIKITGGDATRIGKIVRE